MKLSIIIPYYNAEAWIGPMLDSLLDQDLPQEDYEIIVVDDGSTEEPVTLRRYMSAHPNIRCHRQKNAGVSMARNTGLGLVRGEWIWFCDSDDYVRPQVLGRLLTIAESRQLDLLWFNAVYVRPGKSLPAEKCDFEAVSPVRTGWEYVVNPPAKMGMAVWRYLVRSEILLSNGLRFHDVTYGEGRWFQLELVPHVQRTAYVDVDVYYYVQRQTSIMHGQKRKNYARFADNMFQYLEAVTAAMGDASVPAEARKYLMNRRDEDAYTLLKDLRQDCPVAFSRQYQQKLKALGALPLRITGGGKERFNRFLMNRPVLWLLVCRLYRLRHPVS